jgi:hypothetical protein
MVYWIQYLVWDFKWWAVRTTEPWREILASLDLEWRTFAQKHNAAGHRPRCMYKGMEHDLDPDEKATVYEFPGGDPSAPPDCLIEAHESAEEMRVLLARKTAGLEPDA